MARVLRTRNMGSVVKELSVNEQEDIRSIMDQVDSIFSLDGEGSDTLGQITTELQTTPGDEKENSQCMKTDVQNPNLSLHQEQDFTSLLRQHFGHKSFRPLQLKIIKTLLYERRDVLAVMATGFGKSLCFQFPTVVQPGRIGLVISPLIALMQDQVLSLRSVQISACLLGQGADRKFTQDEIISGSYQICYLTPEYATNNLDFISRLHKSKGISLVAVDEVHCVSQWGHDFRPSYRVVGSIKQLLRDVPFIGVTATATASVRADIISSLHLSDPLQLISSFNRPNLFLEARYRKTGCDDVISFDFKQSPAIVYCSTKKKSELVNNALLVAGYKSVVYHAGMSADKRKDSHLKFMSDSAQIVVATVAFGMGIDKPDISSIVHYGAPKDIESYYQEIGRGGRDGRPCRCVVFYSAQDFVINKSLIIESANKGHTEHRLKMLQKVEKYLQSHNCRRRQLIEHFSADEELSNQLDKCCDNCSNKINSENGEDYSNEAKIALQAVQDLGGKYGASICAQFIRGSENAKISPMMRSKQSYGAGHHKSENTWKQILRNLAADGFIEEYLTGRGFTGNLLRLSDKGLKWMAGGHHSETIRFYNIVADVQIRRIRKEPSSTGPEEMDPVKHILPNVLVVQRPWVGRSDTPKVDAHQAKLEGDLYDRLFNVRNDISIKSGIAAHRIANNKTLASLVKLRPQTVDDLKDVDEFAMAKAETVGKVFIDHIRSFCTEHNWMSADMDQRCTHANPEVSEKEVRESTIPEHCRETYILFQIQKLDLDTLVSRRKLSRGTIVKHICTGMQHQLPVDISRLDVDEKLIAVVESTIRSVRLNSDITAVKPIKELLDPLITYDQLHVALEIIKIKYGFTQIQQGSKAEVGKEPVKLPDWMSCDNPPVKFVMKPMRKRRFALL